jgi:metal-responsive CopG/Arc/MetJ family transcriptional regulator
VKKHLSITIDEKLLSWIDSYIESSNYRVQDRSHVITIAVSTLKDIEEKK